MTTGRHGRRSHPWVGIGLRLLVLDTDAIRYAWHRLRRRSGPKMIDAELIRADSPWLRQQAHVRYADFVYGTPAWGPVPETPVRLFATRICVIVAEVTIGHMMDQIRPVPCRLVLDFRMWCLENGLG